MKEKLSNKNIYRICAYARNEKYHTMKCQGLCIWKKTAKTSVTAFAINQTPERPPFLLKNNLVKCFLTMHGKTALLSG